MSFSDSFASLDFPTLLAKSANTTPEDVRNILNKDHHLWSDILPLLSPAASSMLEEMARISSSITQRRFGKTIQLYVPLYLSNECDSMCLYCGFRKDQVSNRYTLDRNQIVEEAKAISQLGFSHLLIVTGSAPNKVNLPYLKDAVSILKDHFSSLILEIHVLGESQYKTLRDAGADGVTVYQESYDPKIYSQVHPSGCKSDFKWRLDAPDRICRAGMRKVNIGFLLGLADWKSEAIALAAHCDYIYRNFWQTQLSVSFPRITNFPEDFSITPVPDSALVQMILAFRIVFPDMNIVISTRERADFRMKLIPLGVTQISAGSKTTPGGYASPADEKDGQFNTEDKRSPSEIAQELKNMGYEPVWKDWERSLL